MGAERVVAGRHITWAARQHRDRDAIVCGDVRLSFREVNARANRLANALRAAGVGNSDRVAVLLLNSPESIIAMFGVLKAGAGIVGLNARHTGPEQLEVMRDSTPKVAIVGAEFAAMMTDVADAYGRDVVVIGVGWRYREQRDWAAVLAESSPDEPQVEIGPDDIHRLQYTSGTTGRAKGMVYTQAAFQARIDNFFAALEYRLGVDDAMIHTSPLTHAAGMYAIPLFIRGARSIPMARFDPVDLQAIIHRERVTHLLLVPTMLVRLLEAVDRRRFDLSSVAVLNYGTAPLPVEVMKRAIAEFGPILRGHYGLSEAPQPVTILYPWDHVTRTPEEEARLTSCGRPTLNIDLVLKDDTGRAVAPGEVGEITIRSQGVAAVRVWNRPDQTAEIVRDGFTHTGDLAREDAEGFLHIVGRKKDMIITGGFNVYAREVEEALFKHPAVLEAAVFGIPDAEWGEAVTAHVVLKDGGRAGVDELVEHCRILIAGYKKPRYLEIVDQLAKNASGKIDKGRIRRAYVEARFGSDSSMMQAILARY